jgi:hypothetical protein
VNVVKMIFGSHLYGTATETSDRDYKGIEIPSWESLMLAEVKKSTATHTGKAKNAEGVKNGPDDVDTEIYSLHYFIELALKGETVALDMLHAPKSALLETSPVWEFLVAQRHRFYTKSLNALVSYARRQAAKYGVKGSRLEEARKALAVLEAHPDTRVGNLVDLLPTGEHLKFGQSEKHRFWEVCGKRLIFDSYARTYIGTMRDFVARYGERARQAEANEGVDWKAMSHALRAAYQVREIIAHGGFEYPLIGTGYLVAVKRGERQFAEVSEELESEIAAIENLVAHSTLPEQPDRAYWRDWLLCTLNSHHLGRIFSITKEAE